MPRRCPCSSAATPATRERRVAYNPSIPIESFDFIVTDECHRSIYKSWRQVLDYFDAHIIGLTATPSKQTLGFFQQNVVMEYPYERSVLDRVNVDYQIYRIRTEVSDAGATVDAGFHVGRMDKRTRMTRWEQLDEDLAYLAAEVDRTVTARDQIRTILTAYRDRLGSELFPGRTYVPKTLIFAKDDHHAEEIVRIAREVFDKGNDFARKITYRTEGDPQDVLTAFRNEMNPRIAVTVDMIATGTDVKPIEVLIFMRDVKSAIYYEQMKGRGARTINAADLQRVTPDTKEKTHFLLIDAVGVTETLKADSQPLDRKRSVSFDETARQVAEGDTEADTLEAVAARLTLLDAKLEPAQRAEAARLAGGSGPAALARTLYEAVDPDAVMTAATDAVRPRPDRGGAGAGRHRAGRGRDQAVQQPGSASAAGRPQEPQRDGDRRGHRGHGDLCRLRRREGQGPDPALRGLRAGQGRRDHGAPDHPRPATGAAAADLCHDRGATHGAAARADPARRGAGLAGL